MMTKCRRSEELKRRIRVDGKTGDKNRPDCEDSVTGGMESREKYDKSVAKPPEK